MLACMAFWLKPENIELMMNQNLGKVHCAYRIIFQVQSSFYSKIALLKRSLPKTQTKIELIFVDNLIFAIKIKKT